jgi:hypothetical protein
LGNKDLRQKTADFQLSSVELGSAVDTRLPTMLFMLSTGTPP